MGIKKHHAPRGADHYPSYRTRLFIVITSILFAFLVLISYITYFYTVSLVMSEFNTTRLQAEKTFVSSAILTEYGVESFDSRYDFLLNEGINTFHLVYKQNRDNPALIDMENLKKTIFPRSPDDIELYMINKSGVVEYTTYERDRNLDFSQFPDFFSSLDFIRKGSEFRTDPWIRDFYDPKVYWKYGYIPTDDHKYVLELGLRNDNYSQMHKEMLSQLRKITAEALQIPEIVHVEVYDKVLREQKIWTKNDQKNISAVTGIFSEEGLKIKLNETFVSKKSTIIDNPGKNQVISIQYFNLSASRSVSGSELSYVGILVFSTENILKTIQWYRTALFLATLIALVIGLIVAQYLSAYISRPIEMMTEDVSIITSTSLSHSVRATGVYETERLRSNINSLVCSIKEYINEIEENENELKTELFLREKAENSLAKVNKRLIQLSQITRHDILNQITALKFFLEEIPVCDEKQVIDDYAIKAQQILTNITKFLYFTYDYEKIGHGGAVWQNLGDIIEGIRTDFSSRITISYTGENIELLVDQLINKVFYNLVDNTIRHSGSANTIHITFEIRDTSGYLVYRDNGSGIEEKNKNRIFDRGFGKGSGLGMAFIREVLESDDISIQETGVYGQGVRFEMVIPPDHYRIIRPE